MCIPGSVIMRCGTFLYQRLLFGGGIRNGFAIDIDLALTLFGSAISIKPPKKEHERTFASIERDIWSATCSSCCMRLDRLPMTILERPTSLVCSAPPTSRTSICLYFNYGDRWWEGCGLQRWVCSKQLQLLPWYLRVMLDPRSSVQRQKGCPVYW